MLLFNSSQGAKLYKEQLNITQPTLSRQLAALEDELGVKLFDRGGHCSTLTNEGILLKRRALEVVDLEDKIISGFKGQNGKALARSSTR